MLCLVLVFIFIFIFQNNSEHFVKLRTFHVYNFIWTISSVLFPSIAHRSFGNPCGKFAEKSTNTMDEIVFNWFNRWYITVLWKNKTLRWNHSSIWLMAAIFHDWSNIIKMLWWSCSYASNNKKYENNWKLHFLFQLETDHFQKWNEIILLLFFFLNIHTNYFFEK